MDISTAIRTKRAVREFKPRPIPEDIITEILQAGRRAQSAKNRQPWRFVAIRAKATLDELAKLGTYAGHVRGAAFAVVIATPDPSQRWSIMFDAGQAAAYMQLAGWAQGIASCLATIYETDRARQLLNLPDDLVAHVAISFGYPADPAVLSDPPSTGGRLPFDTIVSFERWGSEGSATS